MKKTCLSLLTAAATLLCTSCMHQPAPFVPVPDLPPPAEHAVPPKMQTEPKPAAAPAVSPAQIEILHTLPMGIIGGSETVYLETIPTPLKAKIDTGADTCSLHASNIRYFERDGKPWVSFVFKEIKSGREYPFERRVKRRPKIKRHGAESVQRPVVEMKIKMGTQFIQCDFSLTDRSQFQFPVLIGQNLLNGRAAVDVSRKNLLEK